MATRPPRSEPSNRLPWIALGLGALLIVFGIVAFLLTRRNDVTVSISGTPTAQAVAKPAIPPTLAAPTLPPSQPTTTPPPVPTPLPAATKPPAPTQAPVAAAPTSPPAAPTAAPVAPTAAPAAAPTPAPAAPPPPSPVAAPTAFAGQVADAGGVGNTRADLDAAYGPPTGETPDKLVVYRKDNVEYRVGLAPDINGRGTLIIEVPSASTAQPLTLEAAIAAARKLLPKDAQPPSPVPESNPEFAVQRFTSQSLLAALGPAAFQTAQAPPGQILAIYGRDAQGRITRIIVGVGNDPRALLDRGR